MNIRDYLRRLAEVTLLLSLAGQFSPERNLEELALIALVTIAAAVVSDARAISASAAGVLAVLAGVSDGAAREVAYFGLYLLPLSWLSVDLKLVYLAIPLILSLKGSALLDALPHAQRWNTGTLLFLLAAWSYLLVRDRLARSQRSWTAPLGGAAVIALVVTLVALAQRDGVAPGHLWSDPLFRFSCVAAVTLPFSQSATTRVLTGVSRGVLPSIVAGAIVAAIASWFLRAPVRSIAFDDAHGRWERTDLPFDASEFGRDTTYNYRLLRAASSRWGISATSLAAPEDVRRLVQANPDGVVLVMKTPTSPYEADLVPAIRSWVGRGGVVVAISDHTDLLGMSQHLNAMLPASAGAFDYTALFDRRGFLNRPTTTVLEALLGTPSLIGSPRLFQTGTSFRTPYWNSAVLMTTGLSYREPADYTAVNRFGSFRPQLALRYGSEAAAAVVATTGGGAWILVGDSTPWSNFSIYMPGYLQWWRGVLGAVELRKVWRISAVVVGALPLVLVIQAIWPTFLFRSALAFILGFVLTSGVVSHVVSRAFADPSNVGLHLGSTAVVEFLEPMLPPGALNYSHLFSMLPRLGRVPRVVADTHPPRDFRDAIIMHPDARTVRAAEWAAYVRSGHRLLVIDDPINDNLSGSVALLSELDIAVTATSRPADVPPGVRELRANEWRRVHNSTLTSKAPTTVEMGTHGVWRRFQVGAGEVYICLSGFDLANVSMGDVWAGKLLSVEAQQGFAALADVFGEADDDASETALPSIQLPSHADYVLLLEDGTRERGVVECPALGLPDGERPIPLLWCDTVAFLNGQQTASWRTVTEGRWQMERPVRLSNGQSYLGQVVATDNQVVVEWVHDKAWGDDATHRVAFSVPSGP